MESQSQMEVIFNSLRRSGYLSQFVERFNEIRDAVKGPRNEEAVKELRTHSKLLGILISSLENLIERLIGISLDIFVTCVVNEEFTMEIMVNHNFLDLLKSLLNRYDQDEPVSAKLYEILGNICKHNEEIIDMLLDDLPGLLRQSLKWLRCDTIALTEHNRSDAACMVLRFLRLVVNDFGSFGMPNLKQGTGVIDAVGHFFILLTLDIKRNEKVIRSMIELMHEYSQRKVFMTVTKTIDGEAITYLCHIQRLFAQRIPQIMDKYVRIDLLEPHWLLPDVCDWIIQKLEDLNIKDSKVDYMGYIICLCFLLLDTCVDRHMKYLPQLLKVLESIENPSYADVEGIVMIICTINKYVFSDAELAKSLLDAGLIQAFIETLKWISGVDKFTMCFTHRVKLTLNFPNYYERFTSLGSCNHPNPMFNEAYSTVNYDSNREEPSAEEVLLSHKMQLEPVGSVTIPDDDLSCPCTDEDLIDTVKTTLFGELMDVICTFIDTHPNMLRVASDELVIALLSTFVYFPDSVICQYYLNCLVPLVKSPSHMLHLMQTSVLERITDLVRCFENPSQCQMCRAILKIGHNTITDFVAAAKEGTDKIVEGFLASSEDGSLLVLTLPYIFDDLSLLEKIVFKVDCLNILTRLLKGPLKKRSVKALRFLSAVRLRLADPTEADIVEEPDEPLPLGVSRPLAVCAPVEERPVTLKLDDDSSVQVERSMLMKKSAYFAAMFGDSFMEGSMEEVDLPGVSNGALTVVLQLLENPEAIDQLVDETGTELLLETVAFTDRLVLHELMKRLMKRVVKYRLAPESVGLIYRRSVEWQLHQLRTHAVTFALVHRAGDEARVAMFDSLLGLGGRWGDELIGDIQTLLAKQLKECPKERPERSNVAHTYEKWD